MIKYNCDDDDDGDCGDDAVVTTTKTTTMLIITMMAQISRLQADQELARAVKWLVPYEPEIQ